MSRYVDVDGVSTWYTESGGGEPLVLLHGGFVDSRDFAGNLGHLAERFWVLFPERRGHGHTADVAGPLTFALMAEDTIGFLEQVVGGPAHLVGHSDGATVATLVALRRPDLVRRLVLVSGVFHYDGWLVAPEPGTELPEDLVDAYAEVSPDGRDHLPVVVDRLARSAAREPTLTAEDLGGIASRTLVMVGDDDLVRLEHTLALYRGIPDAELAVVPGTSHGLLHEKPDLCTGLVAAFLTTEPVPTQAPVRRVG